MKSAVLLPLVLLVGLAGGYGLGKRAGMAAGSPKDSPSAAAPAKPAAMPGANSASVAAAGRSAGVAVGRGGPSVQALLAGFDRKKPVESNLRLLQKILAATPKELGEIVRGMSGIPRNDLGWQLAKQSATQRWVEVAPDEALALAKLAPRPGMELHEASTIFRALAEIAPDRALAEAKSLKLRGAQQQAIHSVLQTLAQTDPQRALRLSEDLPGGVRVGVLRTVYEAWATRDPAAAAAGVLALKNTNERGNALDAVMRQFAEQDAAGAVAWAKELPEAGLRMNALRGLFWQLGNQDPQNALEFAAGLPKHLQVEMNKILIGGWARTDPEGASGWILSRSDTVEQQQMILAASSALQWMDPERASQVMTKLAPGAARDNALQNLIQNWTWNDATAAQAFALTLPEAEQQRLRAPMAAALAGRDPDQAIAFLRENPIDDPAHHVWGNIAGALADQSAPGKAVEWALSLENEATRLQALPEIFSRLAAQDPAAAAQEVLRFPAGASREESLARIGSAWAGNDFDDALAWARGLSGKDGESAMGAVLTQGAAHQPTAAATQYVDLLAGLPSGEKPADSLVTAAATIAGAYFAEDQAKAASWVAGLPQEDARAAAAHSLAEQWAQYDAPAASEWIGTLPDGKPRDQAVGSLVNRIAASDPAMAFEWASTVNDAGAREASLEAAFLSWRKLDADEARAAVSSTDWPDEEKTRWLEKLR